MSKQILLNKFSYKVYKSFINTVYVLTHKWSERKKGRTRVLNKCKDSERTSIKPYTLSKTDELIVTLTVRNERLEVRRYEKRKVGDFRLLVLVSYCLDVLHT